MDVVATWTGGLASTLRVAWRLTIEEFADRLGVSVRTVGKWEADPDFTPPLSMQQILDAALDQVPADVRTRFHLLRDAGSASTSEAAHRTYGNDPAASADEIETAAYEAEAEQAGLLAEPGAQSITALWDEAAEIARSSNRSPREIFTASRRIRHQALLNAQRTHRPGSLSDLYVIAGQATALMASTAFDLNQWDAAASLARSAVSYAALVGNPSLQAWTLGLSALLANWRNEPDIALTHFGHGLEVAPPGTPRVRLRFIAARSFALLGDAASVAGVLDQARRDQDDAARPRDSLGEEIGGEFAFGRARAQACAAAAWLDLNCGQEAKEAAHRALAELAALPRGRQPFSQVSGTRIDLATACLMQDERDEAEEALEPVLAVPAAMRNVSLAGRLARTRRILHSRQWAEDTAARQLDDAIGEWLAGRS
jgi:transcriptional regulator with XRE-family HTH domain